MGELAEMFCIKRQQMFQLNSWGYLACFPGLLVLVAASLVECHIFYAKGKHKRECYMLADVLSPALVIFLIKIFAELRRMLSLSIKFSETTWKVDYHHNTTIGAAQRHRTMYLHGSKLRWNLPQRAISWCCGVACGIVPGSLSRWRGWTVFCLKSISTCKLWSLLRQFKIISTLKFWEFMIRKVLSKIKIKYGYKNRICVGGLWYVQLLKAIGMRRDWSGRQ